MIMLSKNLGVTGVLSVLALAFCSCSATPGPDKSFAGAVLGAGWGVGAGAAVGNQVGDPYGGAALGAAVGATNGFLTGVGLDLVEGNVLEQERELDLLRSQTVSNERDLLVIQERLDRGGALARPSKFSARVFFDENRATLRLGGVQELERIAEYSKGLSTLREIRVLGHSDDTGNVENNRKLAEARANTVKGFLSSKGISSDIITVQTFGAEKPLVSNGSSVGKQLNRRAEVIILR